MGDASIYIFPRVLALLRPIATTARPNCHDCPAQLPHPAGSQGTGQRLLGPAYGEGCFKDKSKFSRFIHLIYESSLRAGQGWRESLYRHQGCFEASDCGRLGRQAAGDPWSALRVVKSCRKDCPTASVLLEAKAAALHPERYQSLLSKLSTKEGG
jgi:hypothetical protein